MRTMSRMARMGGLLAGVRSRIGLRGKYRFGPSQTREVPGKKTRKTAISVVLDLQLMEIVNGGVCCPVVSRPGRDGAIAQLGERVVRNDEVGGSIPPGSTTPRLRLRVAQPR